MKTKIFTTIVALLFCGTVVFAQDTTKLVKKQMMKTNMEMQKDSVYYTCTMHPNVKLDKPGKCPECGMDLVKKTVQATNKSEGLTSYTCTMHPEVTSDKPGKCPKCGMDLVPKK
jgi:membrane protease subunit (stomatin/prohibitin family)